MRKKSLFVSAITALFLTGCSSMPQQLQLEKGGVYDTSMASRDKYFLDIERKTKTNNRPAMPAGTTKGKKSGRPGRKIADMTYPIYRSSSSQYRKHHYTSGVTKKFDIVAEDMPVHEFLYYIFQEVIKGDFTIDPKIKGIKEKITLKLHKRLSVGQLLDFLDDLLKPYHVEIIEKKGVYRALYTNKLNDKTTDALITSQSINPNIVDDADVAQYIQCDYIDPISMVSLASDIFIKQLKYRQVAGQNGVIVYGKYKYIKRLFNFKSIIDKPFIAHKRVTLIYFDHILPSAFKKKFEDILSYQNINKRKGYIRMLPLDDISALMVITSKNSDLTYLLSWKNKLDEAKMSADVRETYFYRSKYRSIKEIYPLLSQFIRPGTSRPGGASKQKPKEVANKAAEEKKPEFVKMQKAEAPVNVAKAPVSSGTGAKVPVIIPDEERNLLIIEATPAQYKNLYAILRKIDTQPLQLLVEANIIEVTLKDDLQYGMEWFLKNRLTGDSNAINISGKSNVGVGSGGFFGVVSNQYFNAVLNLFAKKNLIKILSHPKVLVLNGKSASIQVGQSIPLLSSTMSNIANPENTVASVQYSNTGVSLNVTPSVTANGVINMKISQTISKGQENGLSSISSPIIVNRSIDTDIVLRDNQSVVMGGLIQHDVSDTRTKVPLLGDIPVVKNLFSSTSKGATRTELVLVVKIHIIDSFDLLDEVKDQISDILSTELSGDRCNTNTTVIRDTKNLHLSNPDILISPENIDKYYSGELDKYYDEVLPATKPSTKKVVKATRKHKKYSVKKAKVKPVKHKKLHNAQDVDDVTKHGWVFVDEEKDANSEKNQPIQIIDGEKYRIDKDGDYILIE